MIIRQLSKGSLYVEAISRYAYFFSICYENRTTLKGYGLMTVFTDDGKRIYEA